MWAPPPLLLLPLLLLLLPLLLLLLLPLRPLPLPLFLTPFLANQVQVGLPGFGFQDAESLVPSQHCRLVDASRTVFPDLSCDDTHNIINMEQLIKEGGVWQAFEVQQ